MKINFFNEKRNTEIVNQTTPNIYTLQIKYKEIIKANRVSQSLFRSNSETLNCPGYSSFFVQIYP